MITFQNLALQRGNKLLFKDASLSIFAKQKVGVVGLNGCGKSSLFSLMMGKLSPDTGNVYLQSGIKISHLAQEVPVSDLTALQYTMEGDAEVSTLLHALNQAEKTDDHVRTAALHNKLYELGGYDLESRAAVILNGLGFLPSQHGNSVNSFSGGWRMRLNLAKVLLSNADLLLLDEPTNYLDMDAIVWLERWIESCPGTLLLISHDRDFLDNTVKKILHLDHQTMELYTGNYSRFEIIRAEKLALEQNLYKKQQAKIDHLTQYVNRFRAKASKAKQAQSRLKMLEKMEKVTLTQITSPFSFEFKEAPLCSPPAITFDQVDFRYDPNIPVLNHINFSLHPGDRIGILGFNGAGKSTFVKLLAGQLTPTKGSIHRNKQIKIGYFAQYQLDQLNLQQSPLFHLQQLDHKISEREARSFFGSFGFSGDRVFGKIDSFSGGEKARLVLALIIWQKPNVLLLDEPTNHLDLDMREALAYALQEYTGALILVAHDRHLLKTAVDEFYLVHAHQIMPYSGDIEEYQQWLLENKQATEPLSPHAHASPSPTSKFPAKKTINPLLSKLERKLDKLHNEKMQLESTLASEDLYTPTHQAQLKHHLQKMADIEKAIKAAEIAWLEASEAEITSK